MYSVLYFHGFTHLDAFKVVAAPVSERFINHLVSSSESLSSNHFFFSTGTGGTPKIQAQESLVDEIKNGDHTIGGSYQIWWFYGILPSHHDVPTKLAILGIWWDHTIFQTQEIPRITGGASYPHDISPLHSNVIFW